jgi:hypothetical protein
MINYLPEWYCKEQGWNVEKQHLADQAGLRETLDELHLRKIDMADEVVIVNYNGYIGDSTRNEIEYAKKTGKPVSYIYEDKTEKPGISIKLMCPYCSGGDIYELKYGRNIVKCYPMMTRRLGCGKSFEAILMNDNSVLCNPLNDGDD